MIAAIQINERVYLSHVQSIDDAYIKTSALTDALSEQATLLCVCHGSEVTLSGVSKELAPYVASDGKGYLLTPAVVKWLLSAPKVFVEPCAPDITATCVRPAITEIQNILKMKMYHGAINLIQYRAMDTPIRQACVQYDKVKNNPKLASEAEKQLIKVLAANLRDERFLTAISGAVDITNRGVCCALDVASIRKSRDRIGALIAACEKFKNERLRVHA